MNYASTNSIVSLNNGVDMPILGLGVYLSKEGREVTQAVHWALEAGYRHIDTASIYDNEKGVGKAVLETSIDRKDLFIVSKVWNSDQGFDSTLKAYDESLKRLNLDYLDLYLVHWPVKGKYIETWKALEKLYNEGRVRAIGVSNFMKHHLDNLIENSKIVPMVNQMEYHPKLTQNDLRNHCKNLKIQYEAWSPLMQGKIFANEILKSMALKYNKSIAQLVIRWNIQNNVVTIPKSVNKTRIIENYQVFDFMLSSTDMELINALDENYRVGPDPDNFDF